MAMLYSTTKPLMLCTPCGRVVIARAHFGAFLAQRGFSVFATNGEFSAKKRTTLLASNSRQIRYSLVG